MHLDIVQKLLSPLAQLRHGHWSDQLDLERCFVHSGDKNRLILSLKNKKQTFSVAPGTETSFPAN
jgi:hypothetical protein